MFQLKRKSFFRYYLESTENMIVKKSKKEDSFTSNNLSDLQSQKSEVRGSSFLAFGDDFDNRPAKKENKIMKLLKFKNKRENFQKNFGSSSPVKSFNGSFKPEIKNIKKEVEKEDVPDPDDDDDGESSSTSHISQTVLPKAYEKINIKAEPIDPDFDIPDIPPVSIPNELTTSTVSPPKAKRKKNSLAALAKVNPKYIGITGNFICSECPYTSEYITHFERHVKSFHPELSLYQCEICQFQSKSKSYLTVHTMNHLGLKPYKCTMCDYASPRKDYVNMHMKSHTKEDTHFCEFCDYRTYRQDYFNRHVLEKHYKKVF